MRSLLLFPVQWMLPRGPGDDRRARHRDRMSPPLRVGGAGDGDGTEGRGGRSLPGDGESGGSCSREGFSVGKGDTKCRRGLSRSTRLSRLEEGNSRYSAGWSPTPRGPRESDSGAGGGLAELMSLSLVDDRLDHAEGGFGCGGTSNSTTALESLSNAEIA